jgi:hypothetical protein
VGKGSGKPRLPRNPSGVPPGTAHGRHKPPGAVTARHLSLITQRDSQPGRHPVTLRGKTQEPRRRLQRQTRRPGASQL